MPHIVPSEVRELRTESRSASQFAGKRIHFIGIGGSGMSGLARMLIDGGAIVSGSEPKPNAQTFELAKHGAKVSRDQMGELLDSQIDLVVRSAAITDANREFQAARAYGIKTIKYAEMLGAVMRERVGIAVAGTHGKSTTSAMISYALSQCGADPSLLSAVPSRNWGADLGRERSNLFVAEACEFDRSFHNLHPKIALITNIEEDHLDCYKDIGQIVESFAQFARVVPADGLIIAGGDDSNITKALAGISAPIELCILELPAQACGTNHNGSHSAWATRFVGMKNGCYCGEVIYHGRHVATLQLAVPGEHNLINATMAVAACCAVGIGPQAAADALASFHGVDRRMSEVGRFNGAIIVDDYGHHPTEIRATLRALQEKYEPSRLLCVFQPHQHSRTRFLLEDFASSFSDATETIVLDIYFVRDSEIERSQICAADLVARIISNGQSARHLPNFKQIIDYLRGELRDGDLVVTMGAGNVWEIGKEIVS